MKRDQPVDYAKNFEALSKKRIVSDYCWLAMGLIALIVGTALQEYGLIFGGFLSFLIFGLYKDIGVLYLSVGKLLEIQTSNQ